MTNNTVEGVTPVTQEVERLREAASAALEILQELPVSDWQPLERDRELVMARLEAALSVPTEVPEADTRARLDDEALMKRFLERRIYGHELSCTMGMGPNLDSPCTCDYRLELRALVAAVRDDARRAVEEDYARIRAAGQTFLRQATAEECFGCGAPIHHGREHEVGCEVAQFAAALSASQPVPEEDNGG